MTELCDLVLNVVAFIYALQLTSLNASTAYDAIQYVILNFEHFKFQILKKKKPL